MIYLFFVISTLLAAWCGYNKHKLARDGRRITAAFVSSAFPFLISLAVASGVFAIVATVIYWADQDARIIDTLYHVETRVSLIYDFVKTYKLGTWTSVAILAGLWIIPLIRARVLRYPRDDGVGRGVAMASTIFGKYSKGITLAVTFLTLLASFSFFASATEPRLRKLQARLKTSDEKIAKVGAGLSSAFSEEVAGTVLTSTVAKAPSEVTATLPRIDSVHLKQDALQQPYGQSRPLFGVKEGTIDKTLSRTSAVRKSLTYTAEPTQDFQARVGLRLEPHAVRSALVSLTGGTLSTMEARLRHLRENQSALTEIRLDPGRRLSEKIVAGVVEFGVDRAELPFRQVIEDVPFAEPIFDVIKGTMSKLVPYGSESRLVARLVRSVSSGNGSAFKKSLGDQARLFVDNNAEIGKRWEEYLLSHPGKLQREQQKLQHWEKEVDIAGEKLEAFERRRKLELGKIKLRTGDKPYDSLEYSGRTPEPSQDPGAKTLSGERRGSLKHGGNSGGAKRPGSQRRPVK